MCLILKAFKDFCNLEQKTVLCSPGGKLKSKFKELAIYAINCNFIML